MRDREKDPYLNSSGVLNNLLGLAVQDQLDESEMQFATLRAFELATMKIKGPFDFSRLKSIHRHIFQDVYEWAGLPRTVDISKGGDRFAHHGQIEWAANDLFVKLKKESSLKGLGRDDFVDRLAFYFNEMNVVHPFREGNGRASRIFFNQLAAEHGFQIDFSKINRSDWSLANHYGHSADHSQIRELFAASLVSFSPSPKARFLLESMPKRIQECRADQVARMSVKCSPEGPVP